MTAELPELLGLLDSVAPPVPLRTVEDLAVDRFGVLGDATPLTGERDANFRIDDGERRWVLKVSHPAEPEPVADLQSAAIRHALAVDPSLPLPQVQLSRAGSPQSPWFAPDGPVRQVRLYSYLEGMPLASVPADPDLSAALGSVLARLDRALTGYSHLAQDRPLAWDVSQATRLRPLAEHAVDPALAGAALDRFAAEAAPRLGALRHQVVHNDLNPHNVLVAEEDPSQITGIIDFGDMVRAPLVQDLATAAAYLVGEEGHPLSGTVEMVRAYRAVLPLTPDELAVVPLMMAARAAISVSISGWRAGLHPDNRDYILRNGAQAQRTLERLAETTPAEGAEWLARETA
ncbi:MAG: phosphotransferase [Micrococcales bacterium]|nr:phosphotransferase [Micrococcales bacterium]